MIDKTIKHRLAGAGILVLSACILLPLVLDGERPTELNVQVVIEEPAVFNPVPIAKAIPVDKQTASNEPSTNSQDEIQLIPVAQDSPKQPDSAHSENISQNNASTPKTTQPVASTPSQKTTPKKVTKPAGRWTLQIATFKNRANAERLVKKLQAAKYDAYSVTVNDLYKVYVGPEFDREISEQAKAKVKKDFGLNGFIIKYSVNG